MSTIAFILNLVIMMSLGGILYLVARSLPKADEFDSGNTVSRTSWLISHLETLDEYVRNLLEKFLRRLKIWLLKWNNAVDKKLNTFKKENGNGAKEGNGLLTENEKESDNVSVSDTKTE